MLCVATSTFAESTEEIAGQIIARISGVDYLLPMLDSDISVSIEGDIATV